MGKGPVRSCLSSYCSCSRSEFSELLSTSWVRGVFTPRKSAALQVRTAPPTPKPGPHTPLPRLSCDQADLWLSLSLSRAGHWLRTAWQRHPQCAPYSALSHQRAGLSFSTAAGPGATGGLACP